MSNHLEEAELETIKLEKQQKLLEEQRKFRNLESDRKYYAEEAVTLIKKQKGTIEKLKKQNQTLKELIAKLNDKKTNLNQTVSNTTGGNIEQRIQQLKEAIAQEKNIQQDTGEHIKNFQKKIIQKKNNLGGYNAGAENESTLQKQIKILENRLDKANQKFNEAIAVNRQLRQVIDSLRRERVIFDNLYKKLEKELHEKRKEMANIIEKANTAYEERDKANVQIQNLKQQAKKETTDFQKQLKELSNLMEKAKLATALRGTGTDRGREDTPFAQAGMEGNTDAGSHLNRIGGMGASKTTLKQFRGKTNNEQADKIQKYREDFAKIEAATGETKFEALIEIFSKNQQENFKMFKFVNEQSNQIEELEAELHELRQELNEFSKTGDISKKNQLEELTQKRKAIIEKQEDYERQYKQSMTELKTLINHIQSIFNTVECDREVAKEVAGSKMVSESNMITFLGIVEEKIIKIIKAYKDISTRDDLHHNSDSVMQTAAKKVNEAFTFEELDDDDEEYDKILTHEDFKRKAEERIIREQNSKLKKKDATRLKKK